MNRMISFTPARDSVASPDNSDPERRNKMISLRLSDAEYAMLKSQYRKHGARNISDLARLAIQRLIHTSDTTDENTLRLADLESRVHTLEIEVTALLDHKVPS
jgi:hypothetical protein